MSVTVDRSKRPFIVASILVATFMTAVEVTIVATAMPSIVGALGGFDYYGWVFSAFLLAQTTTTVVYGKLADIFGRKPTLIVGTLLFLVGSIFCGFAWSLVSLVGFRFLQGLGAGAIQPVTATILGDLYNIEDRSKAMALLAGVWAISAVTGPLVGGLIVSKLSWAWIFWINLPFGILTIAGFAFFLHEKLSPRVVSIDYTGAVLFAAAVGALMMALTEGSGPAWPRAGFGLMSVGIGWLFLRHERRTPEPLISIELWTRRLISTSNLATFCASVAVIGITTILPIYVEIVLGRSPIVAGLTLSALVIGWPCAVTLLARFYRAFGVGGTLRLGGLIFPAGAAVLLMLTPDSDPMLCGLGAFLLGSGMGLISPTTLALIQDSVEWSMRGSATASSVFARSLGSTIGATAVSALLNVGIVYFGGAVGQNLRSVLSRPTGFVDFAADPTARAIFYHALQLSFAGIAAFALMSGISAWLIPISNQAADLSECDVEEKAPIQ